MTGEERELPQKVSRRMSVYVSELPDPQASVSKAPPSRRCNLFHSDPESGLLVPLQSGLGQTRRKPVSASAQTCVSG